MNIYVKNTLAIYKNIIILQSLYYLLDKMWNIFKKKEKCQVEQCCDLIKESLTIKYGAGTKETHLLHDVSELIPTNTFTLYDVTVSYYDNVEFDMQTVWVNDNTDHQTVISSSKYVAPCITIERWCDVELYNWYIFEEEAQHDFVKLYNKYSVLDLTEVQEITKPEKKKKKK